MKALNLIGQTFGRWKVVAKAKSRHPGHNQWKCRCKCGRIVVVEGSSLRDGTSQQCRQCADSGENLLGQTFGRWKVIGRSSKRSGRTPYWLCRCSCSLKTERVVMASMLKNGRSQSCGCFRSKSISERNTTHGHSKRNKRTPEYYSWQAMIRRCYNKAHKHYHYYGGRGITVCKKWRSSFEAFLADVGRRPSRKHTLDRYPDKNGDYRPGNVRWATKKQQANNRRPRPTRFIVEVLPDALKVFYADAGKHASPINADKLAIVKTFVSAMQKIIPKGALSR